MLLQNVRKYQRGDQKRKSNKDRQHNGLMIEDAKGVISSSKSKKDIEHKSKIKRTKDKQRFTKHDT
jgi:hypothetical protein